MVEAQRGGAPNPERLDPPPEQTPAETINRGELEPLSIGQDEGFIISREELEGRRIHVSPSCRDTGVYLVQLAGIVLGDLDDIYEKLPEEMKKEFYYEKESLQAQMAEMAQSGGWLIDNNLRVEDEIARPSAFISGIYEEGGLTNIQINWSELGGYLREVGVHYSTAIKELNNGDEPPCEGDPGPLEHLGGVIYDAAYDQKKYLPDEVALKNIPI